MTLLRSPQTAVHLVTLLEEMPVQETLDGVAELRAAGLPVGGVVVNMVREPLAAGRPAGRARPRARLDRGRGGRGAAGGRAAARRGGRRPRCSTEAAEHAAAGRCWSSASGTRSTPLGRPVVRAAGAAASGIDLGGLYRLAELLREQGMA